MTRQSWIDPKANEVLIDDYAQKLESFTDAFLDGKIDAEELKQQEQRVMDLMKEVEPQLSDALHEKVTRLLCEMVAFTVMQMSFETQSARGKTRFIG